MTTRNGCKSPSVHVAFKDGTVIQSKAPTYRRAIKVVSKAVNLDWINNQACRLSQNIYAITNILISKSYLFEMIR